MSLGQGKTVWGAVPEEAALLLRGEDALTWLQGQATNDLRPISTGATVPFCLCRPTGQITALARASMVPDGILLTVPRAAIAAFESRVAEFVVMEDVALEMLDLQIWTVQAVLDPPALTSDPGLAVRTSKRSAAGGFDVIGGLGLADRLVDLFGSQDAPELERLRIIGGVPKFGVDIDEAVMPPELGPAFDEEWVSYQKGCYTGQEVLMRIHSRGHTNRAWTLLECVFPVAAGASIWSGEKKVGTVTSVSSTSDGKPVAAAFVRIDAMESELAAATGAMAAGSASAAPVRVIGFDR